MLVLSLMDWFHRQALALTLQAIIVQVSISDVQCEDGGGEFLDWSLEYYEVDCPQGDSKFLTHNEVPWGIDQRAVLTLPPELRLGPSSISGAGTGVFTTTFLTRYMWLAEYEGEVYPDSLPPGVQSDYTWQVLRGGPQGVVNHNVDAGDIITSNWPRWVNCARTPEEETVMMVQCQSKVFYVLKRDVYPGQELLVYYGAEYAETLNIDTEPFQCLYIEPERQPEDNIEMVPVNDAQRDDGAGEFLDWSVEHNEVDCPQGDTFLNQKKVPWGVQQRAVLTLPSELRLGPSSILGAGTGVFTTTFLPRYTWLAEYEGDVYPASLPPWVMNDYTSEVVRGGPRGPVNHYVDAGDVSMSNWVRWLNCPRTPAEETVIIVQCHSKLFFVLKRDVYPGQELMVYYGAEYAETVGIDTEPFRLQSTW